MQFSCVIPKQGLNFGWGGALGTNGPFFELQTDATSSLLLLDLVVTLEANSNNEGAFTFGLGRPAANGTGYNPAKLIVNDGGSNNSTPTASLYTQWTAAPTIPTTFLRRHTFTGAGFGENTPILEWRFPQGLKMAQSSSLVLWVTASTGNTANLGIDVGIEANS